MINKYTIQPPIITRHGDEIRRRGSVIEQWRGSVLVQTSVLIAEQQLTEVATVGGDRIDTLFLEVGMPGQNVSMTNVRENQNTGAVTVSFSSGTNIELGSWEAVGEIADSIDSTPDLAERILLGKAFRASPDGSNKTTQIDASVSTNLLASVPIVYTGPQ